MARILIVDDSSLSRRVMRRILEEAGHTVDEAADGLAALERYAIAKPEMVLLDVTMQEMDGLEVLRQLRLIDPDARVVMATADVQSSTRTLAESGGAVGFIAKPLSTDGVRRAVDSALVCEGGAT